MLVFLKFTYYYNILRGRHKIKQIKKWINFCDTTLLSENCIGGVLYHDINQQFISPNGSIIVNPNARIGQYCVLHGNNCIGNNGKTEFAAICGNNLDLGIGSKLIGGIKLGDDVTVGANAFVNKSFDKNNIKLVGIPAHII